MVAGAIVTLAACEGGAHSISLWSGRVVLSHESRNRPVRVKERPDITDQSEGVLRYVIEIDGEQPEVPDHLEYHPSAQEDPEQLSWVRLTDAGVLRLPQAVEPSAGGPVLTATVDHFSLYGIVTAPDPRLVFQYPVGSDPGSCPLSAAPESCLAPCTTRGYYPYGKSVPKNGGLHTGTDFGCNPSDHVLMTALGYGTAIYNGDGSVSDHGFGRYTAEEYVLDNGRVIVCLSGHRRETADIGKSGLLARGQVYTEVSDYGKGACNNNGECITHAHTECKLIEDTTSSAQYTDPCAGYCSTAELADKKAETLEQAGYRDPLQIIRVRQPLLTQVYEKLPATPEGPVELPTYLHAGKPFYVRLVFHNPSASDVQFDYVRIYGERPGGTQDEIVDAYGFFLPKGTPGPTVLSSEGLDQPYYLPGTYKFFARLKRTDGAEVSTYPLSLEVVEDALTTVADNADAGAAEMSTSLDTNRRGGGYYMDHLRVDRGEHHWIRWYHRGSSGRYKIKVYVPDDECAGTVTYQLSVDGKLVDGHLASVHPSLPLDQGRGAGWRELAFPDLGPGSMALEDGAVLAFRSDDNPGATSSVCLDAVMFEHEQGWSVLGVNDVLVAAAADGTMNGCGNGICEPGRGENCASCVDCPCGSGRSCQNGVCVANPSCGDGVCGNGENCSSCARDCACGPGLSCQGGACVQPSCATICANAGFNCGVYSGCACGTCGQNQVCSGNLCVQQSCAAICANAGYVCGTYSGCSCGAATRTLQCDPGNYCPPGTQVESCVNGQWGSPGTCQASVRYYGDGSTACGSAICLAVSPAGSNGLLNATLSKPRAGSFLYDVDLTVYSPSSGRSQHVGCLSTAGATTRTFSFDPSQLGLAVGSTIAVNAQVFSPCVGGGFYSSGDAFVSQCSN